MKTEFQDLEWASPLIVKRFKSNERSSISAMFRNLRDHKRLSMIGCYPILHTVVSIVVRLGIIPSRMNVLYALNQSYELKEFSKKDKNELLDELLKPLSVQKKPGKSSPSSNVKLKADQLTVQTSIFDEIPLRK